MMSEFDDLFAVDAGGDEPAATETDAFVPRKVRDDIERLRSALAQVELARRHTDERIERLGGEMQARLSDGWIEADVAECLGISESDVRQVVRGPA